PVTFDLVICELVLSPLSLLKAICSLLVTLDNFIITDEIRLFLTKCISLCNVNPLRSGCIWKQPKCPSTDEWIKKMWYINTMEYYSAIKRNEIESFVETWMDLETVIQSEVSQKEKNKYRILTHVCGT
uniref:DUF1725 domain-containing protein n=1 Tax=Balaenoptera musculus TaxID=9771 RepID=A0A8C0CXD9_BALMU